MKANLFRLAAWAFVLTSAIGNVSAQTPFGNALELNGSGQYMTIPTLAAQLVNGPFTIEAWVYLNSYGTWSRLIDFGNGPGSDNVLCALSYGNTGQPVFQFYNSAGSTVGNLVAPSPLPLNTWTHLAFSFDGTTGAIYTNGTLAVSGGMGHPSSVARTNDFIGHSNWQGDSDANAIIDDFRIWATARSAAQIQAALANPLTGGESGLALYFRFDNATANLTPNSAAATGLFYGTLVGNPMLVLSGAAIPKRGFRGPTGLETVWWPNDPNAAVGPNHIMLIINGVYRIYTKLGVLVGSGNIDDLFKSLNPSVTTLDPNIAYDDIAGRFVLEANGSGSDIVTAYLAVSDSSDPTKGFTEVHAVTFPGAYDGSKAGFNADAYVICATTGTAVIDKSSVLDKNNATFRLASRTTGTYGRAARMHGANPGAPMFFTTAGAGGTIHVTRMDNVLSASPTYTGYDVAGSTGCIDPATPAWRSNSLVTANTGDMYWWQVNTTPTTPTLVQEGFIPAPTGYVTDYGSANIAPNGDIGMSYMQFAAANTPLPVSMWIAWRAAADPAGTVRAPIMAVTSSPLTLTNNRHGDFSSTVCDISPNGDTLNTFWSCNGYIAPNGTGYTEATWMQNFGATILTVESTSDSGPGSLRQLVADAPPNSTITFDPSLSGQTVTLTGGPLTLSNNLTISASGLTHGLVLSGANSSQILIIGSNAVVSLAGLTFTQGHASDAGGAIYSGPGTTLSISRCTFYGNSGLEGGALLNDGALQVEYSTFSGNNAGYGGALQCHGVSSLNHCTISGNSAPAGGGGVFNKYSTLTINNSVIASNSPVGVGGDIYSQVAALVFTNANLIQDIMLDRPTLPTVGPTPLSGNPQLAPLGDYGGSTLTMALMAGSAARDAAVGNTLATDQRGFPIVNAPDLGAYEAGTVTNFNAWIYEITLPSGADRSANGDADGDGASNYQEWVAGTDPANAASVLRVAARQSGGSVTINFPTVANRLYTLWTADSLAGPWIDTGLPAFLGTGGAGSFTLPPTLPVRFFRVAVYWTSLSAQTPPGVVLVPAGSFTMGDTLDGQSDAVPVTANISAFYMDANLVTWSQWQTVCAWATNHGFRFDFPGSGKAPNHPAQSLDWFDALKWCNARSLLAGKTPVYYTDAGFSQPYISGEAAIYPNWGASGYRLPTEAEWEKAARGGLSGQRFPWGNTIDATLANYDGQTPPENYDLGPAGNNPSFMVGGDPWTSPVGTFPANGYGLYDMAGNVFQWCWDVYATPYAGGTDPHGPASGTDRVVRGGCWNYGAPWCRTATRTFDSVSWTNSLLGFRAVFRAGP